MKIDHMKGSLPKGSNNLTMDEELITSFQSPITHNTNIRRQTLTWIDDLKSISREYSPESNFPHKPWTLREAINSWEKRILPEDIYRPLKGID